MVAPNPAYNPLPAMVRYLNVRQHRLSLHPHGNNGKVVGRATCCSMRKAATLPSGGSASTSGQAQTWDVTFFWRDNGDYDPDTNPVPSHPGEPENTWSLLCSSAAAPTWATRAPSRWAIRA